MARSKWVRILEEFKKRERPEAVLMVAGQGELMRIAVAWMQTDVAHAKRLSQGDGQDEEGQWAWLWRNARYDRAALLGRIPNAAARTEQNLDALIANRVLYPDGTINSFVERYLKERVVRIFAPGMRARSRGAA